MIHLFLLISLFFSLTLNAGTLTPWGKDADLVYHKENKKIKPISLPTKTCIAMIRFYQNHITQIDGPRSHFIPSSSQYTLLAIQKYGVFKGIALGCDRLLRENSGDWLYPLKDGKKIDYVR